MRSIYSNDEHHVYDNGNNGTEESTEEKTEISRSNNAKLRSFTEIFPNMGEGSKNEEMIGLEKIPYQQTSNQQYNLLPSIYLVGYQSIFYDYDKNRSGLNMHVKHESRGMNFKMQSLCCIEGCDESPHQRSRKSIKVEYTMKKGYKERGLDKICNRCYYRFRYIFKKIEKEGQKADK